MSLYLNSNFESLIEFKNGLPQNYNGPLLKGSNVFYSATNTYQIIIQEIVTELYLVRLNVFKFFENLALNSRSNKAGIHSRILLKGNGYHKIKGVGSINLKEGEFTMLLADSADCYCTNFKKELALNFLGYNCNLQLYPKLNILFLIDNN